MERVWKGSWLWAVAAVAGLALFAVAVMLSSGGGAINPPIAHADSCSEANGGTPGASCTPTATATATGTATPTSTPACNLDISKTVSDSSVPEGGTADYTITVTNNGSSSCTPRIKVSDVIPSDTDCTDASVDSSSDIGDSDVTIDGCDTSGTVTWYTDANLGVDHQLILDLSLKLTSGASDGDHVTNEACITLPSDLGCASRRITVTGATATPTTGPTSTPLPTVVIPTLRPTTAVGGVAPTISVPLTGTGPSSSGPSPLTLALGLLGGVLLLATGTALVKRAR